MNTEVDRRSLSGDQLTYRFTLNNSSIHSELAVTSLGESVRQRKRERKDRDTTVCILFRVPHLVNMPICVGLKGKLLQFYTSEDV